MAKSGKRFFNPSKLGTSVLGAVCSGLLCAAGAASAATISFNTVATAEGDTIGAQFAPAVTFTLNPLTGSSTAFYGAVSSNGTWTSVTDGTVTSSDLGAEAAADAGIRQLHAYGNTYGGWLGEDGDPDYLLTFSSAISSISVVFAGDSSGGSGLAVYGTGGALSNVTHVPVGANSVNETATITGINSKTILLVPGSYNDWVSVVSITYTFAAVPEPSTWAMLIGGAAVLGAVVHRRRTRQQAV